MYPSRLPLGLIIFVAGRLRDYGVFSGRGWGTRDNQVYWKMGSNHKMTYLLSLHENCSNWMLCTRSYGIAPAANVKTITKSA